MRISLEAFPPPDFMSGRENVDYREGCEGREVGSEADPTGRGEREIR